MKFHLVIKIKIPTIKSFLHAEHERSLKKLSFFFFFFFFFFLRFISKINFMLSWVEHEKSFITSGPDLVPATLTYWNPLESLTHQCFDKENLLSVRVQSASCKTGQKKTISWNKRARPQIQAGLGGSVGCESDWWSEGCRFDPWRIGNNLIMKYFLGSFSPFKIQEGQ